MLVETTEDTAALAKDAAPELTAGVNSDGALTMELIISSVCETELVLTVDVELLLTDTNAENNCARMSARCDVAAADVCD